MGNKLKKIKRCKFCNKKVTKGCSKNLYCNLICKANYYRALRTIKVNETKPEEFIKELLEKPVNAMPEPKHTEEIYMNRIVPNCGTVTIFADQLQTVGIQKGDAILIHIKLLSHIEQKEEQNAK